MKNFIAYLVARLNERSTWLGLISVGTALGLATSADQQNAIVAAGLGLAGLVTAFTKDNNGSSAGPPA